MAQVESALRKQALSYPETHEDFPWGHRAIKVKGKAFLFMAIGKNDDNSLSLSVKLPFSARAALDLPFASPTEYGLGKSGWVTARFGAKDVIPMDLLHNWVGESFRAIAPQRVLARFETENGTVSKTAAAKRITRKRRQSRTRARK